MSATLWTASDEDLEEIVQAHRSAAERIEEFVEARRRMLESLDNVDELKASAEQEPSELATKLKETIRRVNGGESISHIARSIQMSR